MDSGIPVTGRADSVRRAASFRTTATGERVLHIDQTRSSAGWLPLGEFPLDPRTVQLRLDNVGGSGVVIADAVRFRVRSTQTTETLDDSQPSCRLTGTWYSGSSPGGNLGNYRWTVARSQESASATWTPSLLNPGSYEVAIQYVPGSNRSRRARFVLTTATGPRTLEVDQTRGGGWVSLGTHVLDPATAQLRLSNGAPAGGVVIADAVRFTSR